MDFLKKKSTLLAVVVAAVILVSLGGYLLVANSSKQNNALTPTPAPSEENVPTMTPADIGLSLSLISSGKFANNGVDMQITKLNGISAIDYTLDYTAQGGILRGTIGNISVSPTDQTIDKQLPFGTCSDVCHYDTDISGVKLIVKVTKSDGTIYQIDLPFSL